jgi:hypothetical protein
MVSYIRNRLFAGTLALAAAVPCSPIASAQLSKGHMILLNRGLQIEGMTTADNYFHPATFSNANYTAVCFLWDSSGNLGPISTFTGPPPGSPWGRWAGDENNMPGDGVNANGVPRDNEIPFLNQLVGVQLGDEWNLNDTNTLNRLVNWFNSVRTNWPDTILYHNNWGGQIADPQLADYVTRAQPDMLCFDTYPWQSVYDATQPNSTGPPIPGPGSTLVANWFGYLRQDREYARGAGIPLGVYRQTFHAVQDYNTTVYRDPSPSELRLSTFAPLAFNAKFIADFTYNTGAASLFTNAFGGAGDSFTNANGLYGEITDINKRARNLGRALTRLTAISTEAFVGYTTSILILRGKDASGNPTPVPIGFMSQTATNTYWQRGLNDPFLAAWGVTNTAHIKNNGYPGDVVIAWFKLLHEALDGTGYNGQLYFMVVNALTDPAGTAADCKQRITLDFNNPPQTTAVLLDPATGLLQTNNLTYALGNWRLTLDLNGGDAALFKLQTGAPFAGFVTPAPAKLTPLKTANGLSFSVSGTVGARYQLEYAPSLPATTWTPVTNLVFFSSPVVLEDPAAGGDARFYRVTGTQ